jgi:hypothetical protein
VCAADLIHSVHKKIVTTGRNSSSEHFDMLPFIGLLMCVLGVLLFVTLSVAALALGPNVKEGWLPLDAQDKKKTPILLEWDGKLAVIHNENQLKSIEAFLEANGKTTPELLNFLTETMAKRKTHYVLFAVRPSGFKNFQLLADEFRDRKVDVGYEPIPQDKNVRLLKASK